MSDIYAKLFDCYARDVQRHLKAEEEEALAQLVRLIPALEENRVDLADQLADLRAVCCAESLALGIQIGLRLGWEITAF